MTRALALALASSFVPLGARAGDGASDVSSKVEGTAVRVGGRRPETPRDSGLLSSWAVVYAATQRGGVVAVSEYKTDV